MGEVWKAFDSIRDELVVIKQIVLDDETSQVRFRREGDLLAQLEHGNIVRVHESNVVDGTPFIVMELVEGASVAKLLKMARGPLPRTVAVQIMLQVAAGLAYVHAAGIIHRDVSSQNVMVTKSGVVKLIDFGIAKPSGGPALTAPGQVLGKPGYMAPEQYLGDEIDARIDVFGAAVVFYELLSGQRPYGRTRGRQDEVMQAVMAGRFPPLASHGLTGPLPTLIERAMHPDRTLRPDDGAALLAALRAVENAPLEEDGEATIRALHAIAPSALTASDAEHKRLREAGRTEVSLRSERPTDPGAAPPSRPMKPLLRVPPPKRTNRIGSVIMAALVGAAIAVAFLVGRSTGFDAGKRAGEPEPLRAAAIDTPAPEPTAPPAPAPKPRVLAERAARDVAPEPPRPARMRRRIRPRQDPTEAAVSDAADAGRRFLLQGRLGDSQQALEECVRLDPDNAACHRYLGVLFAKQDDTVAAVRHYRRYIELAPTASDADRVRAMLKDVESP